LQNEHKGSAYHSSNLSISTKPLPSHQKYTVKLTTHIRQLLPLLHTASLNVIHRICPKDYLPWTQTTVICIVANFRSRSFW
jgi:hypothetical protein